MNDAIYHGQKILLGVTGTTSAYTGLDLVNNLEALDLEVQVVLSAEAHDYLGERSFENDKMNQIIDDRSGVNKASVDEDWDLIVVAPASFDFIGRIASGIGDSILAKAIAGTSEPVLIVPAMKRNLFTSQVTQANLAKLRNRGMYLLSPEESSKNTKDAADQLDVVPDKVISEIADVFEEQGLFSEKKILITAGPDEASLRSYGYISAGVVENLGYQLGSQAKDMGGDVLLISGTTDQRPPAGVGVLFVDNLRELDLMVMEEAADYDIILMAGFSNNWGREERREFGEREQTKQLGLDIKESPDIVRKLGKLKDDSQVLVDFVLEEDLKTDKANLMEKKNLDGLFVLDRASYGYSSFNLLASGVLTFRSGNVHKFPAQDKSRLSRKLLKSIGKRFHH